MVLPSSFTYKHIKTESNYSEIYHRGIDFIEIYPLALTVSAGHKPRPETLNRSIWIVFYCVDPSVSIHAHLLHCVCENEHASLKFAQ